MTNYYLAAFQKYAVFEGRARRAEYWYFLLFNLLISIGISILSWVLRDKLGILSVLYGVAVFLPGLSLCVRRLHDIGKSWSWIFLPIIPIIGVIWFIILMAKDSDPNENKYGPNPKTTNQIPDEPAAPTPITV